jgi:hypothetical protein
MKIQVDYTDGTAVIYNSIREAELGIQETVMGCNFATTVEDIQVEDGPELGCHWNVQLLPTPDAAAQQRCRKQEIIAACGDKHNRLDRCIHCGL